MKSRASISEIIRQTLSIEAETLVALAAMDFSILADVVEEINSSTGRLIMTGVGKSALAAKKITSTLNSTGTPSIYMHAGDAVHGDLGVVQESDIVIILSKSGNSDELKQLVPQLKSRAAKLIGFVCNRQSYLATESDIVIYIPVIKEADPNDLAPTSSIIAHIAMGDAMAMALQHTNGWTKKSFAAVHPAGTLGKRLSLRVADFRPHLKKPKVSPSASIRVAIMEISSKRMGATAVCDGHHVKGIVTDGDLRRMLESHKHIDQLTAGDIMTASPIQVASDMLAYEALMLMEVKCISQLLVVDDEMYIGVLHLHDLLSEGL